MRLIGKQSMLSGGKKLIAVHLDRCSLVEAGMIPAVTTVWEGRGGGSKVSARAHYPQADGDDRSCEGGALLSRLLKNRPSVLTHLSSAYFRPGEKAETVIETPDR